MGRSIKLTLHYKNEGGKTCDSIITSHSMPIIHRYFTKDLVKNWALSPKTCLRGIPCPTIAMILQYYYKYWILLHPKYKHNIFEAKRRAFLPLKGYSTNSCDTIPPIIPYFDMHLYILLLEATAKLLAPCHMEWGTRIKVPHTPHKTTGHACY